MADQEGVQAEGGDGNVATRRSARIARRREGSVRSKKTSSTTSTTSSVARAREAELQLKKEKAALEEKIDQARRDIELLEFEVKMLIDNLEEVQVREANGPEDEAAKKMEMATLRSSIKKKSNEAEAKRINLKYLGKSIDRETELLNDQMEVKRLQALEEEEDNLSQDLSGEEFEEDFLSARNEGERSPSTRTREVIRELLRVPGDPLEYAPAYEHVPDVQFIPKTSPIVNSVSSPAKPSPDDLKDPEVPTTSNPIDQLALVLTQALGKKVNTSSEDTNKKMLGRQAFKIELSAFDGNAAEWPVFVQQFRNVTAACGLSNVENLQRLQRSLKGEAREAVQALLMAPDNVDKIMAVLERRFGNPERIIMQMVQRVKEASGVKEGDYGGLLKFIDLVRNCTETSTQMNCHHFLTNPELINSVVSKLPSNLQLEWGKTRRQLGKVHPDLSDVAAWLEGVGDVVTDLHQQTQATSKKPTAVLTAKPQRSYAATEKKQSLKCQLCDGSKHHPTKCAVFTRKTIEERWKIVRQQRLCFACLNFGHSFVECRGKKPCGVNGCDRMHHRELHHVQPLQPTTTTETVGHAVAHGHVNLNILPVKLRGPRGTVNTYAMLDPGATLTVIDAGVTERLGLRGPLLPLTHSGLHDAVTVNDSRCVKLTVVGHNEEGYPLQGVRTVPSLPLPKQSVSLFTLKKWKHLSRIPIALYDRAQPTILIGQDHAHLCNTSQLVVGPPNAPSAGKTKLGWVLMGRVDAAQGEQVSYHIREETEDDLHQLVKWHFSTEAFGVKPNVEIPKSKDDARADKIMDETLKRVGGRWECGLLWKEEDPHLPTASREVAYRRLLSMERKMDSDPEFKATYSEKMTGYIAKGYARKLTPEEAAIFTSKTYYLPHFLAENPKKANKKRFVLDAKSKVNGRSLNDFLLPGPDQLKSLAATLFKFREKAVGITADVREMFHRVAVRPEDAVAQRLLWRGENRNREPDVYQMDVLTFGATCSTAIAQRAKNRNAEEFAEKYPETVKAILNHFYMDDLTDSEDSVKKAITRFREMREVMSHGNFDLVGWLSNSKEFMESVPEELRAKVAGALEMADGDVIERVLGLFWDPVKDNFTFSLSFLKMKKEIVSGERLPKKRELLALVASIYDPLGFISIFTIRGKMMLQDSWRAKIGWDDEIPSSLTEKWNSWSDSLLRIQEFQLRRCYSLSFSTAEDNTLHVFVDASEQAYGAVAYIVVNSENGREVTLVNSKARVAPLKPLSIPRMELQAAVLGARLAKFVRDEHTVSIPRTVYWSDSRTVLCWLQGDGRKFQQFVSHRIGELQELSDTNEWRWVPTKENVADEMTRDRGECDWSPSSRWVNGPDFLRLEEEFWPKERTQDVTNETTVELRKEFMGAAVIVKKPSMIELKRFSSWTRLIRVTATVLRLEKKARKMKMSKFISPDDIRLAEEYWWKQVQDECYAEEKLSVSTGKSLPKESKVRNLTFHMDERGVMRLDGRLSNAAVDEEVKCPVLLDAKHDYTRLLLAHYHQQGGHHGQERVVNEVRQQFHIPQLRRAVRSSWNSCQKCTNNRAQPQPTMMGQLPVHRLEAGVHPFTNCGVDYFGPMGVTIGRRQEKRWGVLFTCLSTRAVHLEVAASLNTDSCILAIRRFIGRRGCPQKMFSDNGTNFHGANNELLKSLQDLDEKKLTSICAAKGIEWHFNPPSAPHMGGSWERLVRSVKVALHSTLKEHTPREEVLQTLFVEAGHSVNSHPLTYVPLDPEDPEALTPNHFLIGRSSNVAPPGLFGAGDLIGRKTWRKAQQLANTFWKRWLKEYLPTLQRRTKWLLKTKPVRVGDVGVEVDPQQPRNNWRLGRVTRVFPGEDKIVRVVEWKTIDGIYRRPVAKLAFFDLERDKEAAPNLSNDAAAPLESGRDVADE